MTDKLTTKTEHSDHDKQSEVRVYWWRKLLPKRLKPYARRTFILVLAIIAAAVVSFVTIDLGPIFRVQAEQVITSQIKRPVHIGRLGTYLFPGRFLVEDLIIEGLLPDDEPFFTTERIVVSMSWLSLLQGEILIDSVNINKWRLVIDSFPGGRHNVPRFVSTESDDSQSSNEIETDVETKETGFSIVTVLGQLLADEGELVFTDHGVPWSVVARNVELTVTKNKSYGGEVSFSDSTVKIGNFEPMTAKMEATYEVDDGIVQLPHIDLTTDGLKSELIGQVDLLNWPEQTYNIVESSVNLSEMKEVFFAGDEFTVDGRAKFIGAWHIFNGGRELTGEFVSEDTVLNPLPASLMSEGLDFSRLQGSLIWTRDRFEVFDFVSDFYGGALGLGYSMNRLDTPAPWITSVDMTYREIAIASLFEALKIKGVRPEGLASGYNVMTWPLGQFSEHTGNGQINVSQTEGNVLMARDMLDRVVSTQPYAGVPFIVEASPWNFPMGGTITYTVSPEWVEILPSRLATPHTEIEFQGRTAFGEHSRIPFHVSSSNWQESDRLMASFLTATGRPTGEIEVHGFGLLDGVMLGSFASPKIEARFSGKEIQAWNVQWGTGSGSITVENSYLDVTEGLFKKDSFALEVEGQFAFGFPRQDGGEEIDARFSLISFPAANIRIAFGLTGYDIDGPLSGELHLFGKYSRPFGFGLLELSHPTAYGEPFELATASLRFEGDAVRIDGLNVSKGNGFITGAALIRWNETYSFNVDARDIGMDSIDSIHYAGLPFAGVAQFVASGVGSFNNPRYEVHGSISNFTISDEVVGQVTGRIDVRDGVMGLDIEAASPRLAVSGSGRVNLAETTEADLLFRFTNTNLDPYIRIFQPELPDSLTTITSGTLSVVGPLRSTEQLLVDVIVEQLEVDFYDYIVSNNETLQISLKENVVRVKQMQLIGEDTELVMTGQIALDDDSVSLRVNGDAGLGILQGFFPDIRSSGYARLKADIGGTIRNPILTGEAEIDSGRVRHFSFPHGLENINGRVIFEPEGLRFDYLMGELGGGQVQFGGQLGLNGYALGNLNITAVGNEMQLRFPEGVRSLIDAELTLGGNISEPLLSGTVDVLDAIWLELFEPSTGLLLDFTSDESQLIPQTVSTTIPLSFDIRIFAPSTLRISDNTARIVSSAELTLGGTYSQPLLFGNAEIERGEVFFEGNRYRVTRGNIGFANPNEVNPIFDIEAETDVRLPSQTYRVTLGVVGTMDLLDFELSSDPPLPEFEILALLLGDVRDPQVAEIRALRAREESRRELFQAGAARLLTSPLSSGVGQMFEDSFGVDTFQITPSLSGIDNLQSAQLSPTARLLIGKRISERAHVTLSRALTGANQDLIVVLEYDQSDALSWVLSQNQDRTYALDFRVRHAF